MNSQIRVVPSEQGISQFFLHIHVVSLLQIDDPGFFFVYINCFKLYRCRILAATMASVGRLLRRFWKYVVYCYENKVWRAKEAPSNLEMGPIRSRGYIEFPSHGGFTNAAYYAGWAARFMEAPSRMDIRFISHVYYAFAWYVNVAQQVTFKRSLLTIC